MATRVYLGLVLSRWLKRFCPAAAARIGASVLGREPESVSVEPDTGTGPHKNLGPMTVKVEAMGAGVIVVPALTVNGSDTVGAQIVRPFFDVHCCVVQELNGTQMPTKTK